MHQGKAIAGPHSCVLPKHDFNIGCRCLTKRTSSAPAYFFPLPQSMALHYEPPPEWPSSMQELAERFTIIELAKSFMEPGLDMIDSWQHKPQYVHWTCLRKANFMIMYQSITSNTGPSITIETFVVVCQHSSLALHARHLQAACEGLQLMVIRALVFCCIPRGSQHDNGQVARAILSVLLWGTMTALQSCRLQITPMNALRCRFLGLHFTMATRLGGTLYLAATKAFAQAFPAAMNMYQPIRIKHRSGARPFSRLRQCRLAIGTPTLIIDNQVHKPVRSLLACLNPTSRMNLRNAS